MDEYRRNIADRLPQIAIDFFATFSRFEFALKRGGFARGEIGGAAHPNWQTFARALGDQFFQRMRVAQQAEIFFREPPRILKRLDDDTVDFVDPDAIVNGQMLFDAIKVVRNNLFHGEKAAMRQRDHDLITASLFVLDSAMAACRGIENCQQIPVIFRFDQVAAH